MTRSSGTVIEHVSSFNLTIGSCDKTSMPKLAQEKALS